MLEFKQKTYCEYAAYNIYDSEIDDNIGELYRIDQGSWFLELNERCNGINLQDVEDIYVKMKQLNDCTPQEIYFKHQKELLDGNYL